MSAFSIFLRATRPEACLAPRFWALLCGHVTEWTAAWNGRNAIVWLFIQPPSLWGIDPASHALSQMHALTHTWVRWFTIHKQTRPRNFPRSAHYSYSLLVLYHRCLCLFDMGMLGLLTIYWIYIYTHSTYTNNYMQTYVLLCFHFLQINPMQTRYFLNIVSSSQN